MRHRRKINKLGRKTAHIKSLRMHLVRSLFEHERIVTTITKAKAFRPFAEGLITKAKKGGLHNFRQVLSELQDVDIVKKLFTQIAPRFAKRPGGYTRILRLGACRWEKDENSDYCATRLGDASERVIFELVDRAPAETQTKGKAKAEDKGTDKPKKKEKAEKKNKGPRAPRLKDPKAKTSQTKK